MSPVACNAEKSVRSVWCILVDGFRSAEDTASVQLWEYISPPHPSKKSTILQADVERRLYYTPASFAQRKKDVQNGTGDCFVRERTYADGVVLYIHREDAMGAYREPMCDQHDLPMALQDYVLPRVSCWRLPGADASEKMTTDAWQSYICAHRYDSTPPHAACKQIQGTTRADLSSASLSRNVDGDDKGGGGGDDDDEGGYHSDARASDLSSHASSDDTSWDTEDEGEDADANGDHEEDERGDADGDDCCDEDDVDDEDPLV